MCTIRFVAFAFQPKKNRLRISIFDSQEMEKHTKCQAKLNVNVNIEISPIWIETFDLFFFYFLFMDRFDLLANNLEFMFTISNREIANYWRRTWICVHFIHLAFRWVRLRICVSNASTSNWQFCYCLMNCLFRRKALHPSDEYGNQIETGADCLCTFLLERKMEKFLSRLLFTAKWYSFFFVVAPIVNLQRQSNRRINNIYLRQSPFILFFFH